MGSILVLGSNGFLGSCLVNELLKTQQVVGYDAFPCDQYSENANYNHIVGDFCTENRFAQILKEYHISAVYHLISTSVPQEGTAHVYREIESNILPTVRLFEAMVKVGVSKLIFASSGGTVYGEGNKDQAHLEMERLTPVCSYGIQKATIEAYLQLYKRMHVFSPIIARIANPYGPNSQKNRIQGIIPIFIRKLINGESIELYGDTVRDYLYIDDVIEALVRMLHYQGTETVFNIGSGEGIWLNELVSRVETCIGIKSKKIIPKEIRSCDVVQNVIDISRAEKELGWRPRIMLEEGIIRTFQAIQQE